MNRPVCDVCGRAVARGRGILAVDTRAAMETTAEMRSADRRNEALLSGGRAVDLTELEVGPAPVPWEWGHARCVRGDYAIDEDRIDTPGKALDWTLHLMKKAWFEATDWERAVRRLGLVEKA